jgi:hypothetical protein
MSNSVFTAALNSVSAGVNFNITEVLAPRLVSKLYRSREWLEEENARAFSDATLNRVLNLIARHTELLAEIDAAAGSDGSIGLLFERGVERVYADFLNNGRIRVFIRNSNGVDRKFITEDDTVVSASLSELSSAVDNTIEIRTQAGTALLNLSVAGRAGPDASYVLPRVPAPVLTIQYTL